MKEYSLRIRVDSDLMEAFLKQCLSNHRNPEHVIADFVEDVGENRLRFPVSKSTYCTFAQFLYREGLEEEYKIATENKCGAEVIILFGLTDKEKEEAQITLKKCEKTIADLYKRYVEAMSDVRIGPQNLENAIDSVKKFEERVSIWNRLLLIEEEEEEEGEEEEEEEEEE